MKVTGIRYVLHAAWGKALFLFFFGASICYHGHNSVKRNHSVLKKLRQTNDNQASLDDITRNCEGKKTKLESDPQAPLPKHRYNTQNRIGNRPRIQWNLCAICICLKFLVITMARVVVWSIGVQKGAACGKWATKRSKKVDGGVSR